MVVRENVTTTALAKTPPVSGILPRDKKAPSALYKRGQRGIHCSVGGFKPPLLFTATARPSLESSCPSNFAFALAYKHSVRLLLKRFAVKLNSHEHELFEKPIQAFICIACTSGLHWVWELWRMYFRKGKKEGLRRKPIGAGLMAGVYSTIASVGQTDAHVPQPVQVVSSISNLPSPSLMASTGHSSAQVPQETQSSVILYAMASLLVRFQVSLFLSAQTGHRTFLYIRR